MVGLVSAKKLLNRLGRSRNNLKNPGKTRVLKTGWVAEWFIAPVLKTGVV